MIRAHSTRASMHVTICSVKPNERSEVGSLYPTNDHFLGWRQRRVALVEGSGVFSIQVGDVLVICRDGLGQNNMLEIVASKGVQIGAYFVEERKMSDCLRKDRALDGCT